ncbi:hypothetical protein B0H11DRAFT_1768608 [Mycena galericulata]|nr:hypothetical protein B0H11DRAFT_1768608 [Mycena galericulata]
MAGLPSDFILRSCDGVDFHLHKDMLKLVSGCFSGMFSLPGGDGNPCPSERDGKPVVALPEPESVLHRLLSLAYPPQFPELYTLGESDLDGVVALHEAAHKYQFIQVHRLLERMLENPALIDAHPHRLFAIARLRDVPELARKAALSTLKSEWRTAQVEFPEMKILTWDHAHKLQDFHRSCGITAKKIVERNVSSYKCMTAGTLDADGHVVTTYFQFFVWWGAKNHGSKCGPKCGTEGTITGPAPWLPGYIARLAEKLYLLPTGNTAAAEALTLTAAERAIIDGCPVCSERAERDLRIFTRKLASDIDNSNDNLGQCPSILHRDGLMNLFQPSVFSCRRVL